MKQSDFKYYLGILLMLFVDTLHIIFFENDSKFDVYLYYDHSRYLTNILYDIASMVRFSILTYWLISINRRIFTPLFILSILMWFSYFICYNQLSSLFLIPAYFATVIIYNKKNL